MLVPETNTRVRCTGDDESAPKDQGLTYLLTYFLAWGCYERPSPSPPLQLSVWLPFRARCVVHARRPSCLCGWDRASRCEGWRPLQCWRLLRAAVRIPTARSRSALCRSHRLLRRSDLLSRSPTRAVLRIAVSPTRFPASFHAPRSVASAACSAPTTKEIETRWFAALPSTSTGRR